jgi:hypothetical protein
MKYPPKVRMWEVLIRPSLWLRNDCVDIDFDRWLSEAMDRGEPIKFPDVPSDAVVYTVEIAGLHVWIQNAPYADATTKNQVKYAASRRTALRLRRALLLLMRERFRFQPPPFSEAA